MIFDQCFTPNLYKYLLKTARANRSFSSFLTAVSHQSYLNICSKLNSEIVHFHDFRHRFHTKVVQISAQNQVRKSFISVSARRPRARTLFYVLTAKRRDSSIVYLQYSSIIPGGVARAPEQIYYIYSTDISRLRNAR